MVINALNSGAKGFMADFEDANSPTGPNMISGQANLTDAIEGTIEHSENGKEYALNDEVATLLIRPRGWHLIDRHIQVDGGPVSGSLMDAGLYLFHNAQRLIDKGTTPLLYLPKMESHLEARLWNSVFEHVAGRGRRAARLGARDGAHRDDPGRVRDGRDPLRAARALRRAERRALGLHLLVHQDVPGAPGGDPARTARR